MHRLAVTACLLIANTELQPTCRSLRLKNVAPAVASNPESTLAGYLVFTSLSNQSRVAITSIARRFITWGGGPGNTTKAQQWLIHDKSPHAVDTQKKQQVGMG